MNEHITQDQYYAAFDWLEKNIEKKVFQFDIDDFSGMVEQVTRWSLTKS